jgi:hypothetical protein
MAAPDFSRKVRDLLAFRSGLICNNPHCYTLTIGPSEINPLVPTKVGEAAHIHAARKGEARYDDKMTDDERADIDNGIWLCANCHTMIDKNNGQDFPVEMLLAWKQQHSQVIRSLLLSHKSPLPMLRRMTEEGKKAQEVVNLLEAHGAFYEDFGFEMPPFVEASLSRVRQELNTIVNQIEYDIELRDLICSIAKECQKYMNRTGHSYERRWRSLQAVS